MLVIDHYRGTNGPIICLETDSAPDLFRLLGIFRSLAQGGAEEVELCGAMHSHVVNLRELRLRRVESGLARRARLIESQRYVRPQSDEQVNDGPRPPAFVWSDSRSGWGRCAEIVARLLRRNTAAHRDLTEEGIDDALVELSFRQAR